MTLIDGDRIITALLYNDEYEEFTEKEMSIIDFINAYSDEGVTTADDVLDNIRVEILNIPLTDTDGKNGHWFREPQAIIDDVLQIIYKYVVTYPKSTEEGNGEG